MKKIFAIIKYKFFSKIDDNLIVFMSFNGKYADGPKYLTKHIHDENPKLKLVWLLKNIDNDELPSYVKKVKINTKEAWNYYCKAKIVIDNVYCNHEVYLYNNNIFNKIKFYILNFLKYKKNKRFYTTWHGTPLKKMSFDAVNNNNLDFSCTNTKMILDNSYTEKIMTHLTKNKIDVVLLGSPRNDILFDKLINNDDIKKELKLPLNKKIILYAPSFRENNDRSRNIEMSGLNQFKSINMEKLLNKLSNKFGEDWIFVCRFHYHVEKEIDWVNINKKFNDKVYNGNKYEDISKYLKCSDVLITDMSSILFDFSLMNKPVFLLFPDIDNYISKERGLYFDMDELPYSCALNFDELLKNIDDFNNEEYNIKVQKFMNKLGYVNNKVCSKKVAKYILEDAYGKEYNK